MAIKSVDVMDCVYYYYYYFFFFFFYYYYFFFGGGGGGKNIDVKWEVEYVSSITCKVLLLS